MRTYIKAVTLLIVNISLPSPRKVSLKNITESPLLRQSSYSHFPIVKPKNHEIARSTGHKSHGTRDRRSCVDVADNLEAGQPDVVVGNRNAERPLTDGNAYAIGGYLGSVETHDFCSSLHSTRTTLLEPALVKGKQPLVHKECNAENIMRTLISFRSQTAMTPPAVP